MQIQVIKATKKKPKKLRVCIYARVSSISDEMMSSYHQQVTYLKEYVESRPEWELTEIYADKGISGYKSKRPEFQRLLTDARAGKFEISLRKWIQTHYCEPGHKPHEIRHFTVIA